jgi:hypothetical protein
MSAVSLTGCNIYVVTEDLFRFKNEQLVLPQVDTAKLVQNNAIVDNGTKYLLDAYKKGNVLQYKKNSSNLTKNQRYAQIAKGAWTNRTKTWASQTETTSSPNTSWLKNVNNRLLCNVTEDPYTGKILNQTSSQECDSSSFSGVPGPASVSCWNDGMQTYYPRTRLTYSQSSNNWRPKGRSLYCSTTNTGNAKSAREVYLAYNNVNEWS